MLSPMEFVYEYNSVKAVVEQVVAMLHVVSKVFHLPDLVRMVQSMIGDLRYISSVSKF